MQELEGELLQLGIARGKADIFLQIPTAAGEEGAERLDFWRELGQAQAERLGSPCKVLEVLTREDAFKQENIEAVENVALIYLSGGDPHFLATIFHGTPLWDAIVRAWRSGTSLAGCSAGAMVLGQEVMAIRKSHVIPGLALLPTIQTIPHYDRFLGWLPDRVAATILRTPVGVRVLGIDEETALVRRGSTSEWKVWGVRKVHLLKGGEPRSYLHGEVLLL